MSEISYKILILGTFVPPDVSSSLSSVGRLSRSLEEAFKDLGNIEVITRDKFSKDIPEVDFIILIAYFDNDIDYEFLRQKSKCKKIVSIREVYFPKCDFSFVFNHDFYVEDKSIVIPAPCYKKYYKNVEKIPNSILIDHYWKSYLGTDNDWTDKIEDWLEEIKDKFTIYKIIRLPEEENRLRPYEIPIEYTNFKNYLSITDKMESFVVTHKESYGHSILDMLARGIRVITPPDILPKKSFIDYFSLPVFTNKEEFYNLINIPPDKKFWDNQIEKMTDFSEIVKIIDEKFKEWLR